MIRASGRNARVVLAKPGLDRHDVGARVVVRPLGFKEIFTTGSKCDDIVNFIRENVR